MNALVLFFDCFIISRKHSCADTYTKASFPRLARMIDYRSAASAYRHVDKIEVVKYVLASYATVDWSHVVIRFECEDVEESQAFGDYARGLFPRAWIENRRSDTAQKWVAALRPLLEYGNPWVFFSPNNDHPLVGQPTDLLDAVALATDVERFYPDHVVSVLYSHWTESCSTVKPSDHDWGMHVRNFSSVLGETQLARVVVNSHFMCDSIKVFRLQFLLDSFGQTATQGRLIRLEETGLYLSEQLREVCVTPNREICRHYDAYMHAIETTPPLFIPDGFFDSNIRVRFGFDDRLDGWVNVNPLARYSYLGGVADLRCLESELPPFWKPRIREVVHAPARARVPGQNPFEAHAQLKNPYAENYFGEFYVHAALRLMQARGVQPPVSALSISKKPLAAGENLELQPSATGGLVAFVESGAVQAEGLQRADGQAPVMLVMPQQTRCLALASSMLVIVRFD